MKAYYNEFDPKAAAWLRELVKAGLIPQGEVDERSITDVRAVDLAGYSQCHFFAGIGGWSYALRLAGWPEDRPVWTGSCPCQPFSSAGKKLGEEDARHLSPVFCELIAATKPPVVFGEQVASAVAKGWVDDLFSNLEPNGYSCGASTLQSFAVGAWHARRRLYWVASHADSEPVPVLHGCCSPERGREAAALWEVDAVDIDFGPGIGRKCVPKPPCGWVDDGLPGRLVRMRGYGNAIVPQVAAAFIEAYCS